MQYGTWRRVLRCAAATLTACVAGRAALQDRWEVRGGIHCKAELEGVPDVCVPLAATRGLANLHVHHCARVRSARRRPRRCSLLSGCAVRRTATYRGRAVRDCILAPAGPIHAVQARSATAAPGMRVLTTPPSPAATL